MKDYRSLTNRSYGAGYERNGDYRTKHNVSYDFGPINNTNYEHDQSKKLYCDILGCKYCRTCCEETLRETSFVRSLTEAEDFISKSTTPSRNESTAHTWRSHRQDSEINKGGIENERVDHIVDNIFPIMYQSLSLRLSKTERAWTSTDSSSTRKTRTLNGRRIQSGNVSTLSINSLDSADNFGDDERSDVCSRNEVISRADVPDPNTCLETGEFPIIETKIDGNRRNDSARSCKK